MFKTWFQGDFGTALGKCKNATRHKQYQKFACSQIANKTHAKVKSQSQMEFRRFWANVRPLSESINPPFMIRGEPQRSTGSNWKRQHFGTPSALGITYSTPGLASHHHHPTQDDKHDSYTITFTSNIFQLFPLPGVNHLDNLLRLAILTSLGIVISCAAPGVLDGGIRTEEQQLRNDVQIPLLHRLMQRKGHEKDLGRRPPWGKSAMPKT